MLISVNVGNTVCAAFHSEEAALKFCVKNLSPRINPVIKKTDYAQCVAGQKRNNNEARRSPLKKFTYLKPGDFQL